MRSGPVGAACAVALAYVPSRSGAIMTDVADKNFSGDTDDGEVTSKAALAVATTGASAVRSTQPFRCNLRTNILQDTYVKLIFVAELVLDEFDVPAAVNGFSMNAERLLTCEGKGRKLSQLRTAVLALAYEAIGLSDKDVKACLKFAMATYARKEVIGRCRRYRNNDPEFRRHYTLARYRLIGEFWATTSHNWISASDEAD